MFMTSDLTGHVCGEAESSSSCLSRVSAWEWPPQLCLVFLIFCYQVIPSRNSNGININNYSLGWFVSPFFLSILLENSTNYSSDLGKNRWPFPITSPVQPYHGSSSLESEVTLTYSLLPNNVTSVLKGIEVVLKPNLGRPSWFKLPS